MRREFAFYLYDLRAAGEAIQDFTRELVLEFLKDARTQAAVERKLSVIGEIMVQVRHHFSAQVEVLGEVRAAAALRNVLVHEYDRIMPEEIWRIIQTDVPALLTRLQPLIAEDERQHG